MRPIELLFITANILTFLVFVVPRLRALCWMRPLVLIALVDFTDLDLLSPLVAIPGIAPGPIGSQRAHDIVNAYSLAFFEKHLKKKPEALLTGPSTHYPEVIFARRGP